MATEIKKQWIENQPDANEISGSPREYVVVFHTQFNVKVPAGLVLEFGRKNNAEYPLGLASLSGDIEDYIPYRGKFFEMFNGSEWTIQDVSAFALDFQVIAKAQSLFETTVVYRAPNIGMGENPSSLFSEPKDPIKRAAELWFDFQNVAIEKSTGFLRSAVDETEAIAETIFATGAGETIEGIVLSSNQIIMFVEYMTLDGHAAYNKTLQLNESTNDRDMKTSPFGGTSGSLTIKKHRMQFIRAQQSRLYSRSWDGFVVRLSFLLSPTKDFVLDLPNTGRDVLIPDPTTPSAFIQGVPKDTSGQPLTGPFTMNAQGHWEQEAGAITDRDRIRRYRVLKEADYTDSKYMTPA